MRSNAIIFFSVIPVESSQVRVVSFCTCTIGILPNSCAKLDLRNLKAQKEKKKKKKKMHLVQVHVNLFKSLSKSSHSQSFSKFLEETVEIPQKRREHRK